MPKPEPAERSVEAWLNEILDAVARAKVAEKRLRLADSLKDETGLQIAFQAVLYNMQVIAVAIQSIPAKTRSQEPATPWSEFVLLGTVVDHDHQHIVPETIRRTVEDYLTPLDAAVRRLKSNRSVGR